MHNVKLFLVKATVPASMKNQKYTVDCHLDQAFGDVKYAKCNCKAGQPSSGRLFFLSMVDCLSPSDSLPLDLKLAALVSSGRLLCRPLGDCQSSSRRLLCRPLVDCTVFLGGVFEGSVIPQIRKKISLLPQYRTLKLTITEDEQKLAITIIGY